MTVTDPTDGDKTCWIVTDGKAGNENPCLGLAEAIGITPVIKCVHPRAPWSWLPPALWVNALDAGGADSDQLHAPWPDLLIACGRLSVAPAMAIRRAADGACFTVQLLDPRVPARHFDLVVAPNHDGLQGGNVLSTLGALHRVTPERLSAAAQVFAATVEQLPRPRVAVLIGGATKRHRLDRAVATEFGDALAALARDQGVGLMVTASRRTGEATASTIRERLDRATSVFWDGDGENPYFAYLGLADAILVTSDSVAMVSEACATGKPVHIYPLPGGSAKFDAFHDALRQAGYTRPFAGRIEQWDYTPLNETGRIAAEIHRCMADKGLNLNTKTQRHGEERK